MTNAEVGIAFLVIQRNGKVEMVADSSDCPRMEKEQNALHADCVLVPWYETLEGFLAWYCNGKGYASDTMIPGTSCVQEELVNLRMRLNETEVARYHEIGQECANTVSYTHLDVYKRQIQWIREGKIDLKDYISDYFSFDDVIEAYDKAMNKQVLKKGIVVF